MSDKITKMFRRVIRTGDYETIEVVSTIERAIEDSIVPGSQQYDEQVNILREHATDQLVDDINMIVEKLGVSEKRIKVTSPRPRPVGV